MKVFAALVYALAFALGSYAYVDNSYDVVEVITLNGDVDEGAALWMRHMVDTANENPHVKSVLFQVNSPGGGVYASEQVRAELNRINVPVVVHCQYMCASGAVWIITSPAVKTILVGETTIFGSVGVLRGVQRSNFPPDFTLIKSGKYKVAGTTTEKAEGEDEYLQRNIDQMAQIFYDHVAESAQRRGATISEDDWVHIKNAEVFPGTVAVKMGLADAAVSRGDAINSARLLAPNDGHNVFTREELSKHPIRAFIQRFFL